MSGVNLLDFNMPSPVPSPSGGKTKTKNVGGMKLILPKKHEEVEVSEESQEERRMNWMLILILIGAFFLMFKLATWYARRYGK